MITRQTWRKDILPFLIVGAVLFALLECDKAEPPKDLPIAATDSLGLRPPPILYYKGPQDAPGPFYVVTDSIWLHVVRGNGFDAGMIFTDPNSRIEEVQIWRVEWKPLGDSCFYYIGGFMIPLGGDRYHLPTIGKMHVKIYGVSDGDGLLFWRSHPWPDSIPSGCFKQYPGRR
jgi:hypothetical protein